MFPADKPNHATAAAHKMRNSSANTRRTIRNVFMLSVGHLVAIVAAVSVFTDYLNMVEGSQTHVRGT